ncbi:MAG: right-handed parallel beta-helix repeat-containing protein, partial [Candidatus Omnitrophota bacterium]
MYNSGSSSPTVTNCTFSGNSADLGLGGGMFNNDSSPTVTNCTFTGNSAGGMFNYLNNSNPTVTNCTFTGNSADYEGGGMYNDGSHSLLIVTNCPPFCGGHLEADGGGMYNDGNHPTVANCTFSGNTADWGGGMYNYYGSSPTVSNCILWDNTATSDGNEIYNDPDISHPANPLISYCDIAGSGGSTSWDPNLGSDANGPDGIAGTADDNLRLLWGSPCIDAGDNNSVPADSIDLDNDGNTAEPIPWDLDSNPRIVDGNDDGNPVVDMGAYEYEAMVSCFGINHVKLETKAGKKGNKVELKGTFDPALPIDFARDDVIYIIDDGQGHMLSFIIPAGSFEPKGKPEKQKFKFDSPKHSQPDIKAKFDFLKCKFELKVKGVSNTSEITGESLAIVLQAGENPANLVEEVVQVQVKRKHLEYKREPKLSCCPKCKGITLLEVTSTGPFTGDEYVLVFEPDPGKEKLKRKTVVDDGVNGRVKIDTSCSKPLEVGDVFGAYTVTDLIKIFDDDE